MDPDEVHAFLASHHSCLVGYDDGRPAPAVAIGSYTFEGEQLHLRIAARRDVAGHLAEEPRVCVIVEQSPTYYVIAHVVARGVASHVRLTPEGTTFDLPLTDLTTASFAKLLAAAEPGVPS
jgi:hypothetical protein